jgi:hypothetical protein
MDKKMPTNKINIKGTKRLVLTLAVSSILGFWALFSKINPNLSTSANSQLSDEALPSQDGSQVLLNMPPMPTLIPTIGAANLITEWQPSLPTPTPMVTPALTAPKPGKSFMGGEKVSAGSNKSSPITKTGSSK